MRALLPLFSGFPISSLSQISSTIRSEVPMTMMDVIPDSLIAPATELRCFSSVKIAVFTAPSLVGCFLAEMPAIIFPFSMKRPSSMTASMPSFPQSSAEAKLLPVPLFPEKPIILMI